MKRIGVSGAIVLAVLSATSANAEIVATNLPDRLLISSYAGELFPIDLNGDSIVDFTFAADFSATGLRTERANRLVYRIDPPPNLGGPVASVASGFVIGSNLSDSSVAWTSSDLVGGYVDPGENSFALISLVLDSGASSDFNGRAHVGLEFALSDGIHYGYFDLESGPYPAAILYGWAYETTPGVPIAAGVVPEPGISALLVLGGFLVGGLCLHTRRRHARRG